MLKWTYNKRSKRCIHISWIWLIFLGFTLYTNTWKTMFYIFLMLSVHESMHILVGKCFGYKIDKVVIYPFGICAQMEYMGYGNIFYEFLIILAGPSVHLLFPLVFQWLVSISIISNPYMEYLCMLNMSIFLFNILPIYPLDGGRVLQCLIHFILPFRKAQVTTFIVSLINLLLLYYYQFLGGINGYIILVFLSLQIWMGFQQLTLSQLSFFHYRYLHPAKGKDKLNAGDDLYRSRHNVMIRSHGWMKEHQWLSLYFHKFEHKMKKSDSII